MSVLPPDFYSQWRARQEARLLLRERGAPHPPERLLQNLWHHQRLRREDLRTVDGQPLRVLHPGFWNREPGPDFRGAVLQFGDDEPCSGDVEIDLLPRDWQAHRHNTNPAFAGVILRIVWQAQPIPAESARFLELEKFLDQPLNELQFWAGSGAADHWPETLRGVCSAPLAQLPSEKMDALLDQAAVVRFQRKARDFEIRARHAGWEQTLWEGIFRALGYKHNVWPMQRAAELLPQLRGHATSPLEWQALLLGVAGFLPAELAELPASAKYARSLWDIWWRERGHFRDVLLPKKVWHLAGQRPANHPQRRLALAAHWLATSDFVCCLEKWFAATPPTACLPSTLLDALPSPDDAFWSWHWTFNSARMSNSQPLLGQSRATDLAINVLLPWFWARGQSGKNAAATTAAERRFLAWPRAQDNSLLALARQRLLGARSNPKLQTAARQQGLLQIIHDFCDHSDAICTDCAFPNLVRDIVRSNI